MWGALVVTLMVFSVFISGSSILLIGIPLDYEEPYQAYEKAPYLHKFQHQDYEILEGASPPPLVAEPVEYSAIRKSYIDLAYAALFAGKRIHGVMRELPEACFLILSCFLILISLLASLFGTAIIWRHWLS